MENDKRPSIEEMRAEAVARMKMIGLPQSQIEAFRDRNVITVHRYRKCATEDCSGEEADTVRRLEAVSEWRVWAIMKNVEGGEWCGHDYGSIQDYHYLYVSNDPALWTKEREELAAMQPTMYHSHACYLQMGDPSKRIIYRDEYVKKIICIHEARTLIFTGRNFFDV